MKSFFQIFKPFAYGAFVFIAFIFALKMFAQGEYIKGVAILTGVVVLIIDAKEKKGSK